IPRSRSSSMESSTWARIDRGSTVCVISRMRSASVDFPWSMWAMMQKLRILLWSAMRWPSSLGGAAGREALQLVSLGQPRQRDQPGVDQEAGEDAATHGDELGEQAAA